MRTYRAPLLAGVVTLIVGVGVLQARPTPDEDIGCLSGAVLDGTGRSAPSVKEVLGAFAADTALAGPLLTTAPERERAARFAAAATEAIELERAGASVVFGRLDAKGNKVDSFSVVRVGDAWQLETFNIGLPTKLCEALANR